MRLNNIVLILGLSFGSSLPSLLLAATQTQVTTDVEASMKDLGFHFKQATHAQDISTLQRHITAMQLQVTSLQGYQFSQDKHAVFQQGLQEVQNQLTLIQQLLVDQQFELAKTALKEIDQLRKKYHKERSPSFWQLLFGKP